MPIEITELDNVKRNCVDEWNSQTVRLLVFSEIFYALSNQLVRDMIMNQNSKKRQR